MLHVTTLLATSEEPQIDRMREIDLTNSVCVRACMEKRVMSMSIVFLCCLFLFFFSTSGALWITVPPFGTKCVSEEIHNNVVVLGDYAVVATGNDHSNNSTISIKVTSPYGNNLHHMENISIGNFAFTTRESGNYLVCFWVGHSERGGGDVSVNLDWKTGIAAKDWDSVAKKEKIEGVELQLRKLEGSVEAVHENLIYLRGMEAVIRNVSESTNARVVWSSFMSLGVCIAVSVLQLWHLKRYFHKKKLI